MEHIKGKKDMIMEQHLIYLDNAATTKVNPKVLDAMLPYFCEKFGNASPIYSLAAESKKAITEGREQIAQSSSVRIPVRFILPAAAPSLITGH